MIFDDRVCELGEGPLWHPLRNQLFWFDILGMNLLSRDKDGTHLWRFPEMVSAAGWVSKDELLVASETGLACFNLATGQSKPLVAIEADSPLTRSNDGRTDPQGGFWIGTMGKKAESGAGAIYRYYRGELRVLYPSISIPNSMCFTPDGRTAQFADSPTRRVMRVSLDAQGWPVGTPEVFIQLPHGGAEPDGAVIDVNGVTWLAEWGAARVAAYAPDGSYLRSIAFEAPHTSCPAFGGTTLYCTSALQGMDAAARAANPRAGMTFVAEGIAQGQLEHRVIL